ncbi:MAG: iron-siderophore ABC transporter substrate-binding protein, partial [Cyanobacteria bacterium P01_D01_bin.56]
MKLLTWTKLLLLIVGGVAAACRQPMIEDSGSPSPTTSSCRKVQHTQGDTEVCGQPERIVVLGPYLLEQVLALGVQPSGYGDHIGFHQGDYDNPSQQIPYLGSRVTTQPVNVGLAYQPNIEAIFKAKPDLILAPSYETAQYKTLANIAPTVSFDIVGGKTNLEQIGIALGLEDRVQELETRTQKMTEEAKAQFASVVQTYPKVLTLSSENAQEFNVISHTNSLCGALVHELGFEPVYPEGFDENQADSSDIISLEVLSQLNAADSILLFSYSWDMSNFSDMEEFEKHQQEGLETAWEKNAITQTLDASKAERVYFI